MRAHRPDFLIDENVPIYYIAALSGIIGDLHKRNVLHRDLKPENIFVTLDGKLKIGDFGISTYLRPEKPTTTGFGGTWKYCAPEIVENKEYSYPCDLWSFGIIVFEILYGMHPLVGTIRDEDQYKAAIQGNSWKDLPIGHKRSFVESLLKINPEDRMGFPEIQIFSLL